MIVIELVVWMLADVVANGKVHFGTTVLELNYGSHSLVAILFIDELHD